MLELKNIKKYFNAGTVDQVELFDHFNFNVDRGDFISVIGSNGSGKTTLLNLICGSVAPDEGSIIFEGKNITSMNEYKRAEFIGRVYQDPQMGTCPELTITENMALADNKGKIYGLSPAVNKKRIEYYKELAAQCGMGLENRMNIKVGALSGGQRQALALVIAEMTDVKLLILDEHTAALDPKTSENVMKLTDKMVREKGITTLMVIYNLGFVIEYGTRFVMMDEGKCIMDLSGREKEKASIDDLLGKFYELGLEK